MEWAAAPAKWHPVTTSRNKIPLDSTTDPKRKQQHFIGRGVLYINRNTQCNMRNIFSTQSTHITMMCFLSFFLSFIQQKVQIWIVDTNIEIHGKFYAHKTGGALFAAAAIAFAYPECVCVLLLVVIVSMLEKRMPYKKRPLTFTLAPTNATLLCAVCVCTNTRFHYTSLNFYGLFYNTDKNLQRAKKIKRTATESPNKFQLAFVAPIADL